MEKKCSEEKIFDPTFDATLCGKCWFNNQMGQCNKLGIPIPNRYGCEFFLENEDIGLKPDELGEGQDEPNY